MGCEGDALILCRMLGFAVNSFVRPSQLGAIGRLAPPSWLRSPLGLVACKAYVFQWGYDGKQPSIVSLGTTSRLSGNKLEDDGSSFCPIRLLEFDVGSVPGRR